MRRIVSAVLFTCLAPAAQAAGTFTPPEGCSVWMTVQARACRVSNYYKCTADAPGDQWRADFDQESMFFLSKINREAEWIESYDFFPTVRQQLDPGAEDPGSFSTLLSEGMDTFAFNLSRDDGTRSRVRGFDKLTGKTVVIDGITLQETQFEYEETDPEGNLLRRSRGNEYIHPEWRNFFAGPSEWDGGGGYVPINGSPVQFIFPGEPGFAATEPVFECEAVMSSLPQSGIVPAGYSDGRD
jgi:hypothetical protein